MQSQHIYYTPSATTTRLVNPRESTLPGGFGGQYQEQHHQLVDDGAAKLHASVQRIYQRELACAAQKCGNALSRIRVDFSIQEIFRGQRQNQTAFVH